MDIAKAQENFAQELSKLNFENITEEKQAVIFAKEIIKTQVFDFEKINFCNDNEIFTTKRPTGWEIAGYYKIEGNHTPFSITVFKTNNLWYPTKQYVDPSTKSCSNYILLWVLLSLGCTLMGILMYLIISSAVSI